jgi:hypothetical protein
MLTDPVAVGMLAPAATPLGRGGTGGEAREGERKPFFVMEGEVGMGGGCGLAGDEEEKLTPKILVFGAEATRRSQREVADPPELDDDDGGGGGL